MYLRWLTRTALLLALTVILQMFGWPQLVTGPLVNAMLLLTATFVDPLSGVVVGLLSPWIAFLRGILAAPLAPMIPFIMLGNACYVLIYSWLKGKNWSRLLGLVTASVVKFLILGIAVRFVTKLPPPVTKAMQWPQLITALIGGLIAIAVTQLIPQTNEGN